tara:strand:- start:229109 stop:229540 length:432 start_codon:yes stop_codon:yes gene_type:complete
MRIFFILFTLFFSFVALPQAAEAQWRTREIPDVRLNDIAMVTRLNTGEVVIIYNPNQCRMLGALVCGFFRAHEFGHVNLRHVITRRHPVFAEAEADCWAAQYAPRNEVIAAYNYFLRNGQRGDYAHGTGFQRANRIRQCAGFF